MHPRFRRQPAEQVSHPKRLGHVQPVLPPLDHDVLVTNQTTLSLTSPTSAVQLSSSSPSTISQQTSSPPTSTEPTISPISSLTTSSKSTLSSISLAAVTSPPSPSTTTQSVVLNTASPSATDNSNAFVNAASTKTLSGGAIGGIIAASVVASIVLVIFFVRKTYLRRRQKRRISWPAGNILDEVKPLPAVPADSLPTKPTSLTNPPMSPFEAHRPPKYASPQRTHSPFAPYVAPAPPALSYNNPIPMYSHLAPSLSRRDSRLAGSMANAPADVNSPSTPAPPVRFQTVKQAVVKCAFIPTLPDELSVTAGQHVRVLVQFDDGWDLCANERGEQGMVPRECLDQPMVSDQGDWRSARRTSSLNPDGRQY